MSKLSNQDSAFLKMESSRRPFHVAGLMIFKLPESADENYLRQLVRRLARLNDVLLAVCGGALRNYLAQQKSLRVNP